MVGIVPKKISKADFYGVDKYKYIVRPDLNCYMRSTDFTDGLDIEVFGLHQSCQNGDHYLAHEDGYYYIIKSNFYRRVKDMTEDSDAVVYPLHPNCQGGDHYFSAYDHFYIILEGKGVYRRVKYLNTGEDPQEFPLHPECRNGLYYWGVKDYYYFVKPYDQWGMQYVRCKDFETNEDAQTFSFHESIINFMPGGLSISKGPGYGEWVCIKSIKNDSDTPVDWMKKISKKTGYDKGQVNSVEKNWSVSASVKVTTGGLGSLVTKASLSFKAEYGGCSANTEKENWSEATEVEETIRCNLKPQEEIHVFVYVLGMGGNPILHCRDMRILNSATPPTDNPLPRSYPH